MTSDDAKKALLKLFQCYNLAGTEIDRKIKFESYWEVLSRKAPCFVIEACEYAAKGKCGDGRFLPSAGELFQLAEEFSARAVRSVPKLPPALVENDEPTRQRIVIGFQSMSEDLGGKFKQNQAQKVREQALAWLADPKNRIPQHIKLSGAALAAAGFGDKHG